MKSTLCSFQRARNQVWVEAIRKTSRAKGCLWRKSRTTFCSGTVVLHKDFVETKSKTEMLTFSAKNFRRHTWNTIPWLSPVKCRLICFPTATHCLKIQVWVCLLIAVYTFGCVSGKIHSSIWSTNAVLHFAVPGSLRWLKRQPITWQCTSREKIFQWWWDGWLAESHLNILLCPH